MAQDIFDIDSLDSVVREHFRRERVINLTDFDVPTYVVTPTYTKLEFGLSTDRTEYARQIRKKIEPIVREAESQGYNPNFFTALYETVLNAHQHGNKMDASKKVTLTYKIAADTLEISVIDQGGVLNPEFIPFVLRHKEGRHRERMLDFYEFIGMPKPATNNGTGTSFMHTYVDKVQYFKSEQGGLVVHLTINNPITRTNQDN